MIQYTLLCDVIGCEVWTAIEPIANGGNFNLPDNWQSLTRGWWFSGHEPRREDTLLLCPTHAKMFHPQAVEDGK